jgi:hypothetical protein
MYKSWTSDSNKQCSATSRRPSIRRLGFTDTGFQTVVKPRLISIPRE